MELRAVFRVGTKGLLREPPDALRSVSVERALYIMFGLMIVNCGMNSLRGALILSLIK